MADQDLSMYRIMASYVLICNGLWEYMLIHRGMLGVYQGWELYYYKKHKGGSMRAIILP